MDCSYIPKESYLQVIRPFCIVPSYEDSFLNP